jgi:glycosyltransferase involved in cell wall biosynthesis
MDVTFVSSEHAKFSMMESFAQEVNRETNQVIREIRVTKPIEVLFEGVDIEKYKPQNTPCSIDIKIKEDFAYLFVGHWLPGDIGEDRKNVGLLVKAFYETFKNKSKKPALILKTSIGGTSYMDREEILKRIAMIKATVNSKNLPNVYLLHGEFTDQEMNEIYNHSKIKAMVNLTKGEGFGRPLLEFSLVKKPMITTGWSGQLDYLNPEFVTLLGGELTPVHPSAANQFLVQEAKWFTPDNGQVGHFLKDVFENYKKYQEKAVRQAYRSKTEFSYEKMKELIDERLTALIPEFPKEVKLQLPQLKKIELPKLKKI